MERLVAEGAKVALCARRPEILNAFAEELRKDGADATKPGDMERFIDETVKQYGRLDVVVNNAGLALMHQRRRRRVRRVVARQ